MCLQVLELLNVNSNKISKEGLLALARGLAANRTLRTLELCEQRDRSTRVLFRAPPPLPHTPRRAPRAVPCALPQRAWLRRSCAG